jgi:hypothetical protein
VTEEAPDAPGSPPLPPPGFAARRLAVDVHPVGEPLYRIHPAHFRALFFGPVAGSPPRGRWDAPDGSFRVCYLGERPFVAFAECFLRGPGTMVLETADLAVRAISVARPLRDLRLAAMHGAGLHAAGATAACCSGPYAASRAWAAAVHAHPERMDGIRYRARHDDDGFAVALFDRAREAVAETGSAGLADPARRADLAALLDRYGVGLVG